MSESNDFAEHDVWMHLTGALLKNRYRVVSLLGKSGFSVIYLAMDERSTGAKAIVKLPHPELVAREKFKECFEHEVGRLVGVELPNLVQVMDMGDFRGMPFAVVEYASGGNLLSRFAAGEGGVQPAEVVEWFPPIAKTLDWLHERGFVHRDVKPENILFDHSGRAILSDLAMAKVLQSVEARTRRVESIVGSPPYMAPEALRFSAANPAYDQYSLGVVLYQSLCGRLPHDWDTPLGLLTRKVQEPPRRLQDFAPSLPVQAAKAVMRALSVQPEARFKSCTALVEAFSDGLGTQRFISLESKQEVSSVSALDRTVPFSPLDFDKLKPNPVPAKDTTMPFSSTDLAGLEDPAVTALDRTVPLVMNIPGIHTPAPAPQKPAAAAAVAPIVPVVSPFPKRTKPPAPKAAPKKGLLIALIGILLSLSIGVLILVPTLQQSDPNELAEELDPENPDSPPGEPGRGEDPVIPKIDPQDSQAPAVLAVATSAPTTQRPSEVLPAVALPSSTSEATPVVAPAAAPTSATRPTEVSLAGPSPSRPAPDGSPLAEPMASPSMTSESAPASTPLASNPPVSAPLGSPTLVSTSMVVASPQASPGTATTPQGSPIAASTPAESPSAASTPIASPSAASTPLGTTTAAPLALPELSPTVGPGSTPLPSPTSDDVLTSSSDPEIDGTTFGEGDETLTASSEERPWRPLILGPDLPDWQTAGQKGWSVTESTLKLKSSNVLVTNESWRNVAFTLKVRTLEPKTSFGMVIRAQGGGRAVRVELQDGKGVLKAGKNSTPLALPWTQGEWHQMVLIASDASVLTYFDKKKVASVEDAETKGPGRLGVYCKSGSVEFRVVYMQALD